VGGIKAFAAALLALWGTGSWAALGGAPADFGGVAPAQTHGYSSGSVAYTDIEHQLPSGTVVHEYVDAQGTVFALTWSGPFPPDLKKLLGDHFGAMSAEQQSGSSPGRRSQLSIQRSDLVITAGGHMGAFDGRAWLPAKLPAGFDPGALP
jgi:hypothetical protein